MHVADALSSTDEVNDEFRRRYRSLVGALLYCSVNTRPDIAFAVGYLCRATSKLTPELYADALRLLYILPRAHQGPRPDLRGRQPPAPRDWAVKHSTSGFIFMLNKVAISWGSEMQTSVALSSCEAELMAGSEAAMEAILLPPPIPGGARLHIPPPDQAGDGQPSWYRHRLQPRAPHEDEAHRASSLLHPRACRAAAHLAVPFVKTTDN